MMPNVNIEEVKKYNAALKQYQERAAQIKAGVEYNERELKRLCEELTVELGTTVTPENIERIREERLEKIKNTLMVGNQILDRIRSEEAMVNSANTQSVAQPQVTPSAPQSVGGVNFANIGSNPSFNQQVTSTPPGPGPGLSGIPPIFGR